MGGRGEGRGGGSSKTDLLCRTVADEACRSEGCSQLCDRVAETEHVTCGCREGFHLDTDNKTCRLLGEAPVGSCSILVARLWLSVVYLSALDCCCLSYIYCLSVCFHIQLSRS